jgi:phosphatidylglycerophosphate synthase
MNRDLIIVGDTEKANQMRLGGLTVLERIIKSAKRAGFAQVFTIGEYQFNENSTNECVFMDANAIYDRSLFKTVQELDLTGLDVIQLADAPIRICSLRVLNQLIKENKTSGSVIDYIDSFSSSVKTKKTEIQNAWWRKIQNKEDVSLTEKFLNQKQIKPTDPFVSKYFNRPISLFISRYLVRTSITPNQITFGILILFGFPIPYFFSWGNYNGFLMGALFYHLASVLDGCDGEVARLKIMDSPFGEWLDTMTDMVFHVIFIGGLSFGVYQQTKEFWPIIFGCISFITIFLIIFVLARFSAGESRGTFDVFDQDYKKLTAKKGGFFNKLILFFHPIIKRANYTFLFLILALLGQAVGILYLFTFGPIVQLIFILLSYKKVFFARKSRLTAQ